MCGKSNVKVSCCSGTTACLRFCLGCQTSQREHTPFRLFQTWKSTRPQNSSSHLQKKYTKYIDWGAISDVEAGSQRGSQGWLESSPEAIFGSWTFASLQQDITQTLWLLLCTYLQPAVSYLAQQTPQSKHSSPITTQNGALSDHV
ncbi:hypothetical protein J3459_010188 [Metarhizium acridum]|nr:hypothetical protein J3459_010188 [Metarhizium acridum]